MEPTQIILLVVISILTILLVVVGLQVFLILREGRRTLAKMNKTLEGKELIDFVLRREARSEKKGTSSIARLQERGRRFFHKSGKPLTS